MKSSWHTRGTSKAAVRWVVLGILLLSGASFLFDFPELYNKGVESIKNRSGFSLPQVKEKSQFVLGLDLQGGAHLVYEANVSDIPVPEQKDSVDGVRDVIERRVNSLGVSEPIVQTNKSGDSWRVIVELAGIKDVNEAIDAIGETPVLEFKEESDVPLRDLTKEEKDELVEVNKKEKERAQELLDKIINKGESFENIARENSQDHRTRDNGGLMGYIREDGVFDELAKAVKFLKPDTVSNKIIENDEGYNLVKLNNINKEEKEVKASHILICHKESSQGCSEDREVLDARARAEELFHSINTTNFAEKVAEFSDEPGAAERDGDLGYFSRGQMVKKFEDVVFDEMKVGEISAPVQTEFGYHLIYKQDDRIATLYNISRILLTKTTESDIVPLSERWESTGLSGKQLDGAQIQFDPNTSAPVVALDFNSEGAQLFADLTEKNVGDYIAIFLDGEAISVPVVNQPILDGSAVISGNFTIESAKKLAQRLNAGALPVPIELVSQSTIGASLGEETLERSVKAGMIGLILVIIFMIAYYRLPGLVSAISLVLYTLLVLAVFKMIPVTLTAASIAGFVLSLGMAIDANILIFERMKEELQEGRSLSAAMEEGFIRAWFSIRASNVSSLITAVILMYLATSVVKGFAITLSIGILMSIFTAVTITRYLMRFVIQFTPASKILYLGARGKEQSLSETE